MTTERVAQDPVTQLANSIRGYAHLVSGLTESNLAPLAGMAIEGAREWVTGALANAGGTIAGGAASLEALIPAEIRTIVRQEVESALSGLPGIPSKAMRDELRVAQDKIIALEAEVKKLQTPVAKSSPAKKQAIKKNAPAKKSAPANKSAPAKNNAPAKNGAPAKKAGMPKKSSTKMITKSTKKEKVA